MTHLQEAEVVEDFLHQLAHLEVDILAVAEDTDKNV